MTCGRGGIGRRAALRSLWGKTRGSSSLLDRTIFLIVPAPLDPSSGTRRQCRGRCSHGTRLRAAGGEPGKSGFFDLTTICFANVSDGAAHQGPTRGRACGPAARRMFPLRSTRVLALTDGVGGDAHMERGSGLWTANQDCRSIDLSTIFYVNASDGAAHRGPTRRRACGLVARKRRDVSPLGRFVGVATGVSRSSPAFNASTP